MLIPRSWNQKQLNHKFRSPKRKRKDDIHQVTDCHIAHSFITEIQLQDMKAMSLIINDLFCRQNSPQRFTKHTDICWNCSKQYLYKLAVLFFSLYDLLYYFLNLSPKSQLTRLARYIRHFHCYLNKTINPLALVYSADTWNKINILFPLMSMQLCGKLI